MACLIHRDRCTRDAQRGARQERRRARVEPDDGAGTRQRPRGGAPRVADGSRETNNTSSGATRKGASLEAHPFPLLRHRQSATTRERCNSFLCDTPPRQRRNHNRLGKTDSQRPPEHRTEHLRSAAAASLPWSDVEIRQNIIGHSVPVPPGPFRRGVLFLDRCGTIRVLDQPARQHGRGVFLHPTLQQLGDFLAQIGGVRQAGKLIALQRVTRSRQEKVPRGLGAVAGQKVLRLREAQSNSTVNTVNGTSVSGNCGNLWKTRWAGRGPAQGETRTVAA
jgi:hypothetical protein